MANTINLQSFKLITGFINTTNDAQPGAQASPSGSIIQAYLGMKGGVLDLDAVQAAIMSAGSAGTATLFEGQYQYVQFLGSATLAPALGIPVFWSDRANYVVTTDVVATNVGVMAGVCVFACTKGNWGFIQVSGRATCQFRASLTKVAVLGDLVVITQTPAATFDVLADATTLTSPILKTVVGVATVVPANAGLTAVDIKFVGRNVI